MGKMDRQLWSRRKAARLLEVATPFEMCAD